MPTTFSPWQRAILRQHHTEIATGDGTDTDELRSPVMTGPRHAAPVASAIYAAGIAFAGAILAASAMGLAAEAHASCDPLMLSMTPQPVLSCIAPDDAPPPEAPPGPVPVSNAVDGATAPPDPAAPPQDGPLLPQP
jgi:hypothetical protein